MKLRSKYFLPNSDGFSLIEVVASLLLVGTLLVSVLVAHRRVAHQSRLAQQRLIAVASLDKFLTLRSDPTNELAGELQQPTGKIPGPNPYYWRTSERRNSSVEAWGLLIQRVELFHPEFEKGVSLAAVEMLAPGRFALGANHARP